ncbi:hypothetical protein [Blastococcus sp. SYSU D00813]
MAALGAVVAAVGLGLGLWPQTAEISDVRGVECGSPFFPSSSPAYEYSVGSVPENRIAQILFEDDLFRTTACNNLVLADIRTPAIATTVGGGLVSAAAVGGLWAVRRHGARSAEAHWRAQGFVPKSELDAPPADWVKATEGADDTGNSATVAPSK